MERRIQKAEQQTPKELPPLDQPAGVPNTRHHANVQPDPAFVDRVTASLAPADLLGWAAWRLLPASVALVLVLAWFSLQTGPELELEVSESPMDNLLSWVLEETP